MFDKIKSLFSFAFKVLVALIIINAVLSFFGGTVQAFVLNPIGTLKAMKSGGTTGG